MEIEDNRVETFAFIQSWIMEIRDSVFSCIAEGESRSMSTTSHLEFQLGHVENCWEVVMEEIQEEEDGERKEQHTREMANLKAKRDELFSLMGSYLKELPHPEVALSDLAEFKLQVPIEVAEEDSPIVAEGVDDFEAQEIETEIDEGVVLQIDGRTSTEENEEFQMKEKVNFIDVHEKSNVDDGILNPVVEGKEGRVESRLQREVEPLGPPPWSEVKKEAGNRARSEVKKEAGNRARHLVSMVDESKEGVIEILGNTIWFKFLEEPKDDCSNAIRHQALRREELARRFEKKMLKMAREVQSAESAWVLGLKLDHKNEPVFLLVMGMTEFGSESGLDPEPVGPPPWPNNLKDYGRFKSFHGPNYKNEFIEKGCPSAWPTILPHSFSHHVGFIWERDSGGAADIRGHLQPPETVSFVPHDEHQSYERFKFQPQPEPPPLGLASPPSIFAWIDASNYALLQLNDRKDSSIDDPGDGFILEIRMQFFSLLPMIRFSGGIVQCLFKQCYQHLMEEHPMENQRHEFFYHSLRPPEIVDKTEGSLRGRRLFIWGTVIVGVDLQTHVLVHVDVCWYQRGLEVHLIGEMPFAYPLLLDSNREGYNSQGAAAVWDAPDLCQSIKICLGDKGCFEGMGKTTHKWDRSYVEQVSFISPPPPEPPPRPPSGSSRNNFMFTNATDSAHFWIKGRRDAASDDPGDNPTYETQHLMLLLQSGLRTILCDQAMKILRLVIQCATNLKSLLELYKEDIEKPKGLPTHKSYSRNRKTTLLSGRGDASSHDPGDDSSKDQNIRMLLQSCLKPLVHFEDIALRTRLVLKGSVLLDHEIGLGLFKGIVGISGLGFL